MRSGWMHDAPRGGPILAAFALVDHQDGLGVAVDGHVTALLQDVVVSPGLVVGGLSPLGSSFSQRLQHVDAEELRKCGLWNQKSAPMATLAST